MASKGATINVGSRGEFDKVLGGHNVVIVDFYADWCGPCKQIAPMFEDLSRQHSKPGKVAFCKVNVDKSQDIARAYNVTAMPTFISFVGGQKHEEMRGAGNLKGFVANAVNAAPSVPTFQGAGRTLGGPSSSGPSRRSGQTFRGPSWWSKLSTFNMANALITFFGLYFISLFSVSRKNAQYPVATPGRSPLCAIPLTLPQFDPYKAAETSAFNVHKPRDPPAPIKLNGQRGGGAARPGGVRTLADLGGS